MPPQSGLGDRRVAQIATAGFSQAPGAPKAWATKTPTMTAKHQPVVMTIQPAFCAFDLLSRTPATTPSPSRMRNSVPRSSPQNNPVIPALLSTSDAALLRELLPH